MARFRLLNVAWMCIAWYSIHGPGAGDAIAQDQTDSIKAELLTIASSTDTESDRLALESQLTEYVRRQRAHWNQASSAEWAKIQSKADWESFREAKLGKLASSLGQFPVMPKQLNVQVTGKLDRASDRFVIENLVYESRPGLWVSANLYRPAQMPERLPGRLPEKMPAKIPGILLCHAHHTPKEHGELQDMGMTWARAGCYVLVPDHVGHGERRQHPFVSANSFAGQFRVSRQDYYFRYDSGVQLHLLGDSLMGWMAWDLSRGVDVLLQMPSIDRDKIIILGAVAGGGDPCAVTAVLDRRISAAVPFNFGGPQPETRFPLPDDAETSFNYAGGGSWESTRGLTRTSSDGSLPWVIVGGIAPRRLIYAHEFDWDQARDPVWKRLEAIYGFYQQPNNLGFTHGRGGLRGQPPEATHCTHIGAFHRQRIHQALRDWYQIDVDPSDEFSQRVPEEALRCFTSEMTQQTHNRLLCKLLPKLADERLARTRNGRAALSLSERRDKMRADWSRVLGSSTQLEEGAQPISTHQSLQYMRVERVRLTAEPGIQVTLILLRPRVVKPDHKLPVVLVSSHLGKQDLLQRNSIEYARLLQAGCAVCLADPRGTGESRVGTSRGRNSSSTGLSASLLMMGETLVAGQLRDLRCVYRWLQRQDELDSNRIQIWGDSRRQAVLPDRDRIVPRDDDAALPPSAEPSGCMLALLLSLFEESVSEVCLSGGLTDFRSALEQPQVRIPHDAVIPGVIAAGDLTELTAIAAARCSVRLEGLVSGANRWLPQVELDEYRQSLEKLVPVRTTLNLAVSAQPQPVEWLLRDRARSEAK